MANKKFQVPINLVNLASDPGTASEGDIYYNTTSDTLRLYANSEWAAVGSGGAGGSSDLPGLSDVTISGVIADNEVLAYDTTSSQWINQTTVEAGLIDTSATEQTKTGNLILSGDLTVASEILSTGLNL